jgi:ankyrin repeat protein
VLDGKKTKEESEQMVEKVKLLIESGADVNAKNNTFWTPLHYATGSLGNVEAKSKIVVMLIDAGADINAQSGTGVTSINWTIEPKIVPLLLKLKADPNIADSNGETTLGHAEAQVDFWDTQVLVNVTKNDTAGVRDAKKFKNLFETKVKILKSECEKLGIELK